MGRGVATPDCLSRPVILHPTGETALSLTVVLPNQTIMASSHPSDTGEQILYSASPSMLRNNPIFVPVMILTFWCVVPLLILIGMYIHYRMTRLTITNHKSILRKGILSKHTTELMHDHVRSVGVTQSFLGRILNVGRINISTSSSGAAEISVSGMVNPEKIKNMVQQYQRR